VAHLEKESQYLDFWLQEIASETPRQNTSPDRFAMHLKAWFFHFQEHQ